MLGTIYTSSKSFILHSLFLMPILSRSCSTSIFTKYGVLILYCKLLISSITVHIFKSVLIISQIPLSINKISEILVLKDFNFSDLNLTGTAPQEDLICPNRLQDLFVQQQFVMYSSLSFFQLANIYTALRSATFPFYLIHSFHQSSTSRLIPKFLGYTAGNASVLIVIRHAQVFCMQRQHIPIYFLI